MAKVVVGLFEDIVDARDAVEELRDAGFSRDSISLVARDTDEGYGSYLDTYEESPYTGKVEGEVTTTETPYRDVEDEGDMGTAAAEGAGIGAIVGGLAGLLVGLGALAIPGIGPVLAAGPLVAALAGAGIGAAAGGLLGALVEAGVPEEQAELYAEGVRRGGTLVTVTTSDEMANRAVDILNAHNPVDVDERATQWRDRGWSGYRPESPPLTTSEVDEERATFRPDYDRQSRRFNVVEEEMRVGKREVPTGAVRVHRTTEEKPVEEDVTLRKEDIDVQRRPVDRPATTEDIDAFKEGSFDVTAESEEVVVDKQARVVEEVEIDKDVETTTETIRDTVRRQDVDVERIGGERAGIDEFDPIFRNHFETTYSGTGSTYDQFRPAYNYGYDLARDERYRNREWRDIEPEVRRDWESRHQESTWDEVRDAVQNAWMEVKRRF